VRWDLLRALGEDERRQVLASARRRRFRRGEVLFHRGDPGDAVHLIASGTVAVYIATPTGSMAIFAVFGPGEAVGEMALIEGGERTATAIAMEPAETLSLRREQLDELRAHHPQIDRVLVDLLAARVRRQGPCTARRSRGGGRRSLTSRRTTRRSALATADGSAAARPAR